MFLLPEEQGDLSRSRAARAASTIAHHSHQTPFLGETAVVGGSSTAVGGLGETRVAHQLIPRSESADFPNLGARDDVSVARD